MLGEITASVEKLSVAYKRTFSEISENEFESLQSFYLCKRFTKVLLVRSV